MKKQGIICLMAGIGIILIGCNAKETEQNPEVFSRDGVHDLGGHRIVYFSNENVDEEGGKDWLVLQDLESQEVLYIPDPLADISGVEIYNSEIYLEYQDGEGNQEKLCIPVVFSDRRNNVFRMHYYAKKYKNHTNGFFAAAGNGVEGRGGPGGCRLSGFSGESQSAVPWKF